MQVVLTSKSNCNPKARCRTSCRFARGLSRTNGGLFEPRGLPTGRGCICARREQYASMCGCHEACPISSSSSFFSHHAGIAMRQLRTFLALIACIALAISAARGPSDDRPSATRDANPTERSGRAARPRTPSPERPSRRRHVSAPPGEPRPLAVAPSDVAALLGLHAELFQREQALHALSGHGPPTEAEARALARGAALMDAVGRAYLRHPPAARPELNHLVAELAEGMDGGRPPVGLVDHIHVCAFGVGSRAGLRPRREEALEYIGCNVDAFRLNSDLVLKALGRQHLAHKYAKNKSDRRKKRARQLKDRCKKTQAKPWHLKLECRLDGYAQPLRESLWSWTH